MPAISVSPELISVASYYIEAWLKRDSDAVIDLFYRAEELRYVGTDVHEWWQGVSLPDAYRQHMANHPDMSIEIEHAEAFETAGVGWAALRGQLKSSERAPAPVRWTFVFVLDSGVWRIVQAHQSVAFPNVELHGVELTKTLEGLLDELGEDPLDAIPLTSRQGNVTIMFTDIEDSTRLAAEIGDRAWAEVSRWHDGTVRANVKEGQGVLIKTLGDGAMAVFDSTSAAARAAVDIQRAFTERRDVPAIRVAIGLHVGEAIHTEGDYLGNTVNKAARIASAASGGETIVSRAVRELLSHDDQLLFGVRRLVELKGINEPQELFLMSSR